MPHAVVLPRNQEELHAAVELAAKHHVPILPRTGGSSLAGQAIGEAVILDLNRYLDNVIEVNQEEQWGSCGTGDRARCPESPPSILWPSVWSRPCGVVIVPRWGGSWATTLPVATRLLRHDSRSCLETGVLLSDGSRVNFGPLENGLLESKTQLPGLEGQIYQQLSQLVSDSANQQIIRDGTPKHWRRCGGYNLDRFVQEGISYQGERDPRFNLAKLICGSEGTLGVMHDIKLQLVPVPKQTALAIVHFDDLRAALTAIPAILETEPTASELLDDLGLSLCRKMPRFAKMLETFCRGNPNCVLITEFYGESESELRHKNRRLRDHLRSNGVPVIAITEALTQQQQAMVWEGAQGGTWIADEYPRRPQADSLYRRFGGSCGTFSRLRDQSGAILQ